MIVRVWDCAMAAGIGEAIVATDSEEIVAAVEAHGGRAIMTGGHHLSGSDRIWEAVEVADPNSRAEFIINVQGDLPTIEGETIRASLAPLTQSDADISTLATKITEESERTNPNVVKAIGTPIGEDRLRALYFTRATAPHGEGPLYHHIGLYAYRREALRKFVSLPPSTLEKREKLEQLRALEAGMRIDIALVDAVPLGVDTPEDLERARKAFI